jgi:hypothetical protein
MRIPYASRSLRNEYQAIGKVVADDSYLNMTEANFISECLKISGGSLNPERIRQVYKNLMTDAGLQPTNTETTLDDGGNQMWEYYSEGKFVSYEEYMKSAHKSYFEA